jgi:Cu(I)/Ag(I) efflux system membrane fusion protein
MLANPALAANVKPGTQVAFEFVERKPGEYVVTRIESKGGAAPSAHGKH